MKITDVTKKYCLDKNSFLNFIVEHKLPVTTHIFSGASIDDANVEFYVRVYNGYQSATRGEYPFTDTQQSELEMRIGELISEGISETKLSEFDSLTDQSDIQKWLRLNKPNYDRDLADLLYKTVFEIERGKQLQQ